MSLNDFFDKIYCINLDRRPDRWEASQKEFDRIGIEVERVSAVDGSSGNYQGPLLPGEFGILQTHAYLLGDIYLNHPDDISRILILEDDIEFGPSFNENWERWSREIPGDWDMLYLGGNLVGWHPSPVSRHVHRGGGVFAAHALGLNRIAMQKFLYNDGGMTRPVDVTYAQMGSELNSYIISPRMAFQRSDYSDIQKQHVNYQFLKQGQFPEVMGR